MRIMSYKIKLRLALPVILTYRLMWHIKNIVTWNSEFGSNGLFSELFQITDFCNQMIFCLHFCLQVSKTGMIQYQVNV